MVEKIESFREIPKEAKFVTYVFPHTSSSLQKILLMEWEESHPNKLEKDRDSIIKWNLSWHAYWVFFKDAEHNTLPDDEHPAVYLINWELIDRWEMMNAMNVAYYNVSPKIKPNCEYFIKSWEYIDWADMDKFNYLVI